MTLIELLIVIIILTTIVAAAIPIMAPADGDRANREATRSLNTFITSAQARAIASNRLFGIGLKRLSQDTGRPEDRGVCVQVYYVEQQPPYAGFDPNSRARLAFYPENQTNSVLVQFVTRGNFSPTNQDGLPQGWDADLFPNGTIRPGDVVEINGTQYLLTAADPNNNVSAKFDANGFFTGDTGKGSAINAAQILAIPINGTGQMLQMTHDDLGNEIGSVSNGNPPYFTFPAPYKIFRQAVTTSDEPFQMPEGTAIDLRASGLGYTDFFYWPMIHDNDQPITILFNPEGKVARLRYLQEPGVTSATNEIFDEPVVDDLFLLVGRRGAIPAPALDRDASLDESKWSTLKTDDDRLRAREPVNWLTGTSRWILIGSQSGRITTIPISSVDPLALINGPNAMAERTEDLRAQQILASREFTRGTTRETGR